MYHSVNNFFSFFCCQTNRQSNRSSIKEDLVQDIEKLLHQTKSTNNSVIVSEETKMPLTPSKEEIIQIIKELEESYRQSKIPDNNNDEIDLEVLEKTFLNMG